MKGYSKKYSVDKLCAVKELRLAVKLKRENELNASSTFDSDENFAYIIGYTSGGAPHGVRLKKWIK